MAIDAQFSGASSYPGGKSGAGIYQRLINLIPPHDVLVVPFAGHCGVVRHIRPAKRTIVIDRDESVCRWWHSWRRKNQRQTLEIHHGCGIEWMKYNLGVTVFQPKPALYVPDGRNTFIFLDPPYIMSERSTGRVYEHELSDADHTRLLWTLGQLDASRYRWMLCGYRSELYARLDRMYESIDHQVPTRGGLQAEAIWLSDAKPSQLHDHRYIGDNRRQRERIRRRQNSWAKSLLSMPAQERIAMLNHLQDVVENA